MIDPRDTQPRTNTKSRDLRIFDGELDGYIITLPNVMLQGDVTITHVARPGGEQYWRATQPYGNDLPHQAGEWVGTGDSQNEAIINLLHVRTGGADPGPVIRAARAVAKTAPQDDTLTGPNRVLLDAFTTYEAGSAF